MDASFEYCIEDNKCIMVLCACNCVSYHRTANISRVPYTLWKI